MATFSKREQDTAMRIICDFHANGEKGYSIGPEYLHLHGLPKNVDVEQLVDVLQAMGLVVCERDIQGVMFRIDLTDAGKCYFERKADITHEKRIENIRYLITTAIAALALVLSGISLAAQLGLIQLPKA